MKSTRRNSISVADSRLVAAVAVVAGLIAAFADCRPTGTTALDAVLCFVTAAFVTWTGASAPWRALIVASGGAGIMAAAGGSIPLTIVAWAGLGAALWIASTRSNKPVIRAAISAVTVQVVFRLEWDPFFLASALVAAAVILLIVITGTIRRQKYVRRRIYWSTAAVAVAVVLAGVGFGVSGVQARPEASRGYSAMLEGLEFVQSGDMIRGAQILRGASTDLGSAHDDLGAPWAQPARLVPGLAQNRNSTYDVLGRAADAAAAAAEILDRVDIDRLRVVEGQVDLSAFHLLEAPLIELEATVSELRMALFEARTEWLVAPLRSRFDTAEIRAEQVYRQAVGTAELARLGPALLGADGPRRYFVAFVNSAEARATGGLMGNWAEITIDGGQISKSNSGRTAELQRGVMDNAPVLLEAPDEFFERYGRWNINARGETVGPNSWVNTTISPHMPTVGSVYAQLYEGATGRAVDGVFMIDPAGLAALLAVAGPIEIPEVGITLDASNTEQFLVLDQYQFEEADREDLLEAVSEGTIDRVLNSTLPPPHEMARALSDAALEGHLSGFAVRGSEQEFFEFVGIDAAIPAFGSDTLSDVLAVTAINSSGNKIDSFLERDIEYRPVHDPVTGRVDSTLRLTLRNTAPTTGFPDYVIGNILDLPIGTNQMMIEIFSPLEVDELLVDGETISVFRSDEHGLRVALIGVAVPPGGTMVVEATLSGRIAGGPYELIYRPQVLPRRDTLVVEARSGSVRFDHEGSWGRRSVLTAAGIRAWR